MAQVMVVKVSGHAFEVRYTPETRDRLAAALRELRDVGHTIEIECVVPAK